VYILTLYTDSFPKTPLIILAIIVLTCSKNLTRYSLGVTQIPFDNFQDYIVDLGRIFAPIVNMGGEILMFAMQILKK
jgi:hypothetical protein